MATDMNDILSDKPIEKQEPEAKPQPTEPVEKPEREERSAEAPERAASRRKEHQRREWEAQGRDPETGQFLSKKEEPAAPAKKEEAKPEAKPEAKAEPKKDEPKAPEKPEAPAQQQELTAKEKALLRAAEEERRKRQALEQRLAAIEAARQQSATPGAPGTQQPEKPKTFWDDPEGALAAERRDRQQFAVTTRITTSEMIARSRHKDFDDKVAKFHQLAQQTPGLAAQMVAAPDPAEFAYQTAKNHMMLEQAGSLDNLRAEIEAKARAEERAKVEAEFKAKEEERERQRRELTPSLSDVHGGGRKPQPQWTGPTPMTDILKI